MPDARPDRHLAAIVVADVVGYGRLIEADESGTLAAIKRRRVGIIDPLAREFKGRVVKFMGDGVLLEFSSAVDAVEFAVALQERMRAADASEAEIADIPLRVGVNLGDVVIEDGDVFGEGVNIAARLEAMAEPGSVLVSDAVFRQVRGRGDLVFNDLGEQRLKNVSEAIRVHCVTRRQSAQTSVGDGRKTDGPASEKISIAVLPFDNMSGDPNDLYFSDGITEDIITELSRFRELYVVARNSSFQFRGGNNDIREIGRKLDAKFVIEGSVRRAGNRIRITVQLIEAAVLAHIWSDRYDRDMVDVFAIQEEIARTIAIRVVGQTRTSMVERSRARPNLSAYDLFLKARQMIWSYDGAIDQEWEKLLLRVIEMDVQFAAPSYGMLADNYIVHFIATGEPEHLKKALSLGRQAIAANRDDAWANYGIALALLYANSMQDSDFYLRRAIELNPNDVNFLGIHALWLGYAGRGEEGLAVIADAIRRDPLDWLWDIQGILFLMLGRYREAVSAFRNMTSVPNWKNCQLAYCLAKCGDIEQAKKALLDYRPRTPGLKPSVHMDRVLPDTGVSFRKDLVDTLRHLEESYDPEPQEPSDS
ncbi:MAG TPA: adenylate/guanylate cyclase domain-containing protein [Dongiaceae bacterium]|nr:adenylate/guanylate cyclase domain-containing protein [Dongiaceae bacterium]